MKVLWIEDNQDVINGGVLKYFKNLFYTHEKAEIEKILKTKPIGEKLTKYLQTVKNPITVVSDFITAYQNICQTEFGLIVIDVDFPKFTTSDPTDEEEKIESEIKELFKISIKSNFTGFEKDLWSQDSLSGLLLFHLICKKNKENFDWSTKQLNNICFFSANNKDLNSLVTELEKVDKDFRYDSDAYEIGRKNFFSKTASKEKDFMNWLDEKSDPYLMVLKELGKSKTGQTAVEMYQNLISTADSVQDFKSKLENIRELSRNLLVKASQKLIGIKPISDDNATALLWSLYYNPVFISLDELKNNNDFLIKLSNNSILFNKFDDKFKSFMSEKKKIFELTEGQKLYIVKTINEEFISKNVFSPLDFPNFSKKLNKNNNEWRDFFYEDGIVKKDRNDKNKTANAEILNKIVIREELNLDLTNRYLTSFEKDTSSYIQSVCSCEISAHIAFDPQNKNIETKKYIDLLNSLIHALNYMILWYGEKVSLYGK